MATFFTTTSIVVSSSGIAIRICPGISIVITTRRFTRVKDFAHPNAVVSSFFEKLWYGCKISSNVTEVVCDVGDASCIWSSARQKRCPTRRAKCLLNKSFFKQDTVFGKFIDVWSVLCPHWRNEASMRVSIATEIRTQVISHDEENILVSILMKKK